VLTCPSWLCLWWGVSSSTFDGRNLEQIFETAGSDLRLLPRLLAALVLTGLLGWERERKDRPAGLRTHMLVGISACAFVLIGELFVERFASAEPTGLRFDPIRIVEATVAGVSFLGAGTIFVMGDRRVFGLTTAASLLASAAVGMIVAVEHYVLGVTTTLLLLLVTAGLHRLETHLQPKQNSDEQARP
jgi:putative Mg2+ transporter-C (MgtC) family protein